MPLSIREFAPAKINLFLHITGRRHDGYHLLDSLVAFADIGDEITIEEYDGFRFAVEGTFADAFSPEELAQSADSKNLAVRAAYLTAEHYGRDLKARITLTKTLPLAAGIGGGTADAAAIVRGFEQFWKIAPDPALPNAFMSMLGTDFPVCYDAQPMRVQGIGELMRPVDLADDIPIILVNPLQPCATADVFSAMRGDEREELQDVPDFASTEALFSFLQETGNDLQRAACALVPEISDILGLLSDLEGCKLARMSGSGATCFGLFETGQQAALALEELKQTRPEWWAQSGLLKGTWG